MEVFRCDGASDFVKKPFPDSGHTLEKAVHDALAASGRSRPGTIKRSGAVKQKPPQPFECGKMVFSEGRVELCEVKIFGGPESGMIRRILDELRHKNTHGRYVRYDGSELAKPVGCDRGQNGVAEAVQDFRNSVCEIMQDEANVQMNRLYDIILNDRRYGYHLLSKITVRDADGPGNDPQSESGDPLSDPGNDPLNGADDPANNNRQQWALGQMHVGRELRKVDIADHFECSKETARRDLNDLRRRDLIEFIGPSKTGYWRMLC